MPEVKAPDPEKFTQRQKILALMCKSPRRWFYPYEFMQPGLGWLYVGYKAPVRIAEMQNKNPLLFDKKHEDKYMQRRLNMKQINVWYELLPPDLQSVVDRFLKVGDLT